MIFRFPCAVFMVYLWIVRAFLQPTVYPCVQHIYVVVNCAERGGGSFDYFPIHTLSVMVYETEVLSTVVRNKAAAVINEVDKQEGQAWKETKLPTTNFISLAGLNY